MASVASQLMEEVTAHAQNDSLEDVREICADGTYFPNDLRVSQFKWIIKTLYNFKINNIQAVGLIQDLTPDSY